jgi:hypothetical protein
MKRSAFMLLASLMLSTVALAHHSNAEYDRSVLREFEGELVEVRWRNPHVMFKVRAASAAGGVQEWELGGLPIVLLQRAGLAQSMFTVGERVKVAGWVSRTRSSAMLVSNILLPNGQEALFYPQSKLRWSNKPAGGRWASEPVTSARRGFYRIWSVADLGAYMRAALGVSIKLTPAAQAKMATLSRPDPCRPQGMPGTMLNPLPMQFIDRGDQIDLQLTTFGVLRKIHMTERRDVKSVPLADLGYSVGRWIGDTLEVRTTRVGWPYVDDDGRPQSQNMETIERFSLVNDGRVLRYTQTVTDPASLVEPMTVSWDLIDAGDKIIEPVSCEKPF